MTRAWRSAVAVVVLLILTVAVQGLFDRFVIERTPDAVFEEYVGGRLLAYAFAAAVVVVLAVAVGTWRRAAGVALLAVAAGVLAIGKADEHHRLRYVDPHRMPDLLAGYPSPTIGEERPPDRSGPEQTRRWLVPGDDVCATARAAFLRWAGPGSRAESGCHASGRHGEVVLTFVARPYPDGLTEVVVTARPSYGT